MSTFSEMQRMSKIFADEIGWDGQNFTKPDRKEFHKLGADFIKNHPEVIEVLMPGGGSFDSVDDYVAHVESSGRSIEEHVASKLFCVAAQ